MNRIASSLMFLLLVASVANSEPLTSENQDPVIATINSRNISLSLFLSTLQDGVRKTFYHGKIPESEFTKFRHKTLTKLIDEMLLSEYALKLGMHPDKESIESKLKQFEERYSDHPQWPSSRERVLASLREDFERKDLVNALENKVKDEVVISEDDAQLYYQTHPEKFTTPPQYNMAVILIGVDPSSGTQGWEAGRLKADELHREIVDREQSFATLAIEHSGHKSRINGGELGLVHSGMLAEEVESEIAKMKNGEVSQPIRVLEGYIIAKLNNKLDERLNSYGDVQKRAYQMCKMEKREKRWESFLTSIKDESRININMDAINKISIKY